MISKAGKEWLERAKENLEDADALFRSRRYLFATYACHLAVEKALKAVIAERSGSYPPGIHNLLELAKIGEAPLTEEQQQFIAELNMAAITTRYPESLKKAAKDYSGEVVKDYLEKAREVVLWLETAPLSKG